MSKRTGIFLAILLALAGCTAPSAPTSADQAITYWVGRPIAEVVAAWGPPTEERPADGGRLYIWLATQYGRSYYPANLNPEPLPYGAYGKTPEELACRGVMEADAAGVVRRAEWVGYECHYLP